MTTRPARPTDASAIAELAAQLGYRVHRQDVRSRLARILDDERQTVLVAEDDEGSVLGWVHAYVARSILAGTFGEVGGLVVRDGYRGRGIGSALLEAAESWSRAHRAATIRVRSRVERDGAHRFYAARRYRRTKVQGVFEKDLG